MKRIALVFTLFALAFAPSIHAQDTRSGTKQDTLEASGIRNFRVLLGNGFTVQIRGADTDRITYRYDIEGNRLAYEQRFAQADFRLDQRGSVAALEIRFPDARRLEVENNRSWLQRLMGTGNLVTSTIVQRLVIEVPRELSVEFDSRYSDLELSGIEGSAGIQNRSGSVTVSDIGESLQVANEYGNITARDIGGSALVKARSSEIALRNIGSTVEVNSPYSNIELLNVDGDVSVANQSGQLEASEIDGPLTVRGDYTTMSISNVEGIVNVQSRSGELTVSNVLGFLFDGEYTNIRARNINGREETRIENRSANIDLANVSGPVLISGAYMEITLEDMQDRLGITNRSGSVTGNRLARSVQIQGEYTEIDLDNFSGAELDINGRSGDIDVESTGALSRVNIRVAYGDVHFTLTERYVGHYNFHTRYGTIGVPDAFTSNARSVTIPDKREEAVTGTIGNSNARNDFEIQAQNGDIVVEIR